MPTGWIVERVAASAADLHAFVVPDPAARLVRLCTPGGPAVVLGSAQPPTHVSAERCAATGVEVVRRRSGGGAVLVEPGRLVWADVVLPAADPLWEDDVGRSFGWLGAAWVGALGALGIAAVANGGPMRRTEWSPWVCFAGLGPGEVTVGGRKVVGLSQRRTRAGALFHGAALLAWQPDALVELLTLAEADRARARADLARCAAGLAVPAADLEAAFLAALP